MYCTYTKVLTATILVLASAGHDPKTPSVCDGGGARPSPGYPWRPVVEEFHFRALAEEAGCDRRIPFRAIVPAKTVPGASQPIGSEDSRNRSGPDINSRYTTLTHFLGPSQPAHRIES